MRSLGISIIPLPFTSFSNAGIEFVHQDKSSTVPRHPKPGIGGNGTCMFPLSQVYALSQAFSSHQRVWGGFLGSHLLTMSYL